ncbi:neuropeptide CCHamide-1 receptor [Nilaparvata lugens]|uniref:neuropeptide CCHamide-1 receptor n=1 Tax=Nilaparvata lugens TaxID=108931 RepID=UPI00193D7827|nr:neuropeptide CCHamide-1 receptor [Nilaparvata lugens]XP_039294773.1 neuropeptide CCHamide-1 receptor [Nilaparvata lugens]XP_039294780.1 neuropeptide CCHamide-1 receptor [Nilaparvata lugens]
METQQNETDSMELNATSETVIPLEDRPETYVVPVIFALIFLVGVVGNGTLVFIFARHRNMRNVPNTYILSLALGDLLVILSCVPFTSTVYTFESWPYGELICKLSETSKDISIGVSVFTLTALSADRFFAIVDPMGNFSIGGRGATRCTIMIACGIWLLAALCAVPAAITSYIRDFTDNNKVLFHVCYPYPVEWGPMYPKTVVLIKFLFYYAIPLVIIAFFYSLMARHLILSTRNIPGEMQCQVRQVRARKKVAKTVLTFVVVFAVCFFPHHMFMLWFYYYPDAQSSYNSFWNYLRIVGFCLSFINSCINPIALYCVSGTFRKHFDRYLFCCWRRPGSRRSRSQRRTVTRRGWDSTTTAPGHQSTMRRHADPTEITLTTFMNGADKNAII